MRDYITRCLSAFRWAYQYRRASHGIWGSLVWAYEFMGFTLPAPNYHAQVKRTNVVRSEGRVIQYDSFRDFMEH